MLMARIFLIGVDLMIIFTIIKLMMSKKYKFDDKTKLGFSLILAGGIGNLIDRIFRGYVIDYIDFNPLIKYPVFNIADIFVVMGCVIVGINLIANVIKERKE